MAKLTKELVDLDVYALVYLVKMLVRKCKVAIKYLDFGVPFLRFTVGSTFY